MRDALPDAAGATPSRDAGDAKRALPRGGSAQAGLRTGYRQARRRRRRGPAPMSLNLTPMIDTVFNLLFFFMIASRFGAIEGLLSAKLPAKSAAVAAPTTEIPRTPIRIRITADPAASDRCIARIEQLHETALEMRSLPAVLGEIRRSRPGFDDNLVPVYLVADDQVAWDHVVNAYNAAMTAGCERIYFAGGK